jgi:hypothetical protein
MTFNFRETIELIRNLATILPIHKMDWLVMAAVVDAAILVSVACSSS